MQVTCGACGEKHYFPNGEPVTNCMACSAVMLQPAKSSEVVTEANDPDGHATLVWWSNEGAANGTPWRVRHHDGTCSLFKAVRISGTVDFIQPETPIAGLPDGPRGVAVLIDGTMVAGK